jgi:hypothetical protein
MYNVYMRMGNLEVNQPLPELIDPHAIVMLRPWLDAGSVGTMILQRLETRFGARELARLAKPGNFYDFTRYRPITFNQGKSRRLLIPNTSITYARGGDTGNDFIFLHLLEPHMFGEAYTSSIWGLLKKLKIRRYCLVGSFYDMVPHTRPILISGGVSGRNASANLPTIGVHQSNYEGPTTICNLISQRAERAGVEIVTILAHLPNYTEIEEDYSGMVALLQVFHYLYDIPVDEADIKASEAQIKNLDAALGQGDQLKTLVGQLETDYDARVETGRDGQESNLSPEINKFLKEMEKKFKETQ